MKHPTLQPHIKSQVRFPADLLAVLKELAKQHQRSFNGEVIWALQEYVARHQKEEKRD